MYFTEWKPGDGYWESLGSFTESSSTILRVRCILTSRDGMFFPMVRDFRSGEELICMQEIISPLENCKKRAMDLVKKFILTQAIDPEILCMKCLKKLAKENII